MGRKENRSRSSAPTRNLRATVVHWNLHRGGQAKSALFHIDKAEFVMTHDEAFLQAILTNPEDDVARLIYGDWLTDRNDPRGEFIRVQCRLARMDKDNPERPGLEAREREFLNHQEEWLGALRPLVSRWTFYRGFLDTVMVPTRILLTQGAIPWPATVRRIEGDLEGFEAPRALIEFIPESVARENNVLPLGLRSRTLLLAMADPNDGKTLQKLEFILNRTIEAFAASHAQVVEAINRHYGELETESVDTACFLGRDIEPDHVPCDPTDGRSPVARLVALIIAEAVALRADLIHLVPKPDHFRVRYRIGGKWTKRERRPRRLLEPIVARIELLAGIVSDPDMPERTGRVKRRGLAKPFDMEVVIRRTEGGPFVILKLLPPGLARGAK